MAVACGSCHPMCVCVDGVGDDDNDDDIDDYIPCTSPCFQNRYPNEDTTSEGGG